MQTLAEIYKKCFDGRMPKLLKSAGRNFVNLPSQENANKYIHEFFEDRGKGNAYTFNLAVMDEAQGKIVDRSAHMVSAFLLGKYIQRNMSKKIFQGIAKHKDNDWPFEYLWFMTCLYHDTFSNAETCNVDNTMTLQKKVEDTIGGDIEYTIYDGKISKIDLPDPTYYEDDVKQYFKYRLKKWESYDHGILGGYVIFQKLVENYVDAMREHMEKTRGEKKDKYSFDANIQDESCYWNGYLLHWSNSQIDAFARVADAIIAHNIWYAPSYDDDKTGKYKEYGVCNFIADANLGRGLSIEKSPLAYFLSLIDTIEPVKHFLREKYLEDRTDDERIKHIFDNIVIEVGASHIRLGTLDRNYCISGWYEKMSNMPDWLIDIKPCFFELRNEIVLHFEPETVRRTGNYDRHMGRNRQ